MRKLIIDGYEISDASDAYVIAEIGNTHNGDMKTAMDLIRSAKDRGANAVKLQKKDFNNVFTKEMLAMPYNSPFGKTYGEHKAALEFDFKQFRALQAYAQNIGITFFATPFDIASAKFLQSIDVPCFKIASAHITDIELIKYCASTMKPVIISTGACNHSEIIRAFKTCMDYHVRFAFLHCVCIYPAPTDKTNLNFIAELKKHYPFTVIGYSNHSVGNKEICLAAYHYGANIIEVHYTLSREQAGTDHAISLEPDELEQIVISLKDAKAMRGTGEKDILEEEKIALRKMGKSLWLNKPLPKGHILGRDDIDVKIPNAGLPPYYLDAILGRGLARDCLQGEPLTFDKLACSTVYKKRGDL